MGLLSVAKLALYGIFINYYCYYVITGSFIPYGTIVFFAMALGCVGASIVKEGYVRLGFELKCWFLYAALSLVVMSFALDSGQVIDSVFKYVQRLLIVFMVVYICEKENTVKFAIRLLAVNAVACAYAVLSTLGNYKLKLDITSGADLSANDVGALMAFGCFAVMIALGKRERTSPLSTVLKFASVIAMITVIFLTGSRKSIYAVIILALLWILMNGRDYLKNSSIGKIMVVAIVAIIAFRYIGDNLAPYMEDTNLYVRTLGRGAEKAVNSNEGRIRLYGTALQEFAEHPLLGLGFNNFVIKHYNYTHSTYVEPLACSGLLGLLYLVPYITMTRNQIQLIILNKKNPIEYMWQKELFAFLGMFLFVGVGIPYMYKDNPCIILALFIASQHISYRKLYSE